MTITRTQPRDFPAWNKITDRLFQRVIDGVQHRLLFEEHGYLRKGADTIGSRNVWTFLVGDLWVGSVNGEADQPPFGRVAHWTSEWSGPTPPFENGKVKLADGWQDAF